MRSYSLKPHVTGPYRPYLWLSEVVARLRLCAQQVQTRFKESKQVYAERANLFDAVLKYESELCLPEAETRKRLGFLISLTSSKHYPLYEGENLMSVDENGVLNSVTDRTEASHYFLIKGDEISLMREGEKSETFTSNDTFSVEGERFILKLIPDRYLDRVKPILRGQS